MKKKYLKLNAIACIGACCLFIVNCDKKDEHSSETGSITSIAATVENGSAFDERIYDVTALYKLHDESRLEKEDDCQVKSVKYVNGEFIMDLPVTVDDKYLKKIDGSYLHILKVSNKTAKGVSIYFEAYKSGVCVGNFYHAQKKSNSEIEALFVYVDGNVEITGSDSRTDIHRDSYGNYRGETTWNTSYNVSLKKGWNIIYYTEIQSGSTITETATTNVPDGMKWYFNGPGERTFQPKALCPIFPPVPQKLIRDVSLI